MVYQKGWCIPMNKRKRILKYITVLIICISVTYCFLLRFIGVCVLYPPQIIKNIEKTEMILERHQICYNDDKPATITYLLTKNRIMYTIVGIVKPLDHENIQTQEHYITIERIIKQKISVKDYTAIEKLYNKIDECSDYSLIYSSKDFIGTTYEEPPYNDCIIIAYNKKLLFEDKEQSNYTENLRKIFSQISKLKGKPIRYKWQRDGDNWLFIQD